MCLGIWSDAFSVTLLSVTNAQFCCSGFRFDMLDMFENWQRQLLRSSRAKQGNSIMFLVFAKWLREEYFFLPHGYKKNCSPYRSLLSSTESISWADYSSVPRVSVSVCACVLFWPSMFPVSTPGLEYGARSPCCGMGNKSRTLARHAAIHGFAAEGIPLSGLELTFGLTSFVAFILAALHAQRTVGHQSDSAFGDQHPHQGKIAVRPAHLSFNWPNKKCLFVWTMTAIPLQHNSTKWFPGFFLLLFVVIMTSPTS